MFHRRRGDNFDKYFPKFGNALLAIRRPGVLAFVCLAGVVCRYTFAKPMHAPVQIIIKSFGRHFRPLVLHRIRQFRQVEAATFQIKIAPADQGVRR
jgi:hypothetical protein